MKNTEGLNFEFDVIDDNIYLPCYKAYTDISFSSDFIGHKYLIEMQKIVKEWCKNYNEMHFKFRPGINDVRPFVWNNFVVLQRYTYMMSLQELNEDEVMNLQEYKKWKDNKLVVFNKKIGESDIKLHLDFLKGKISNKRLSSIRNDLIKSVGIIDVLDLVDQENNILAQLIYSINNKCVEQLYYFDSEDFKNKKGGMYALYSFMLFFKNQGFIESDFCGANVKNIAIYKKRFPVKLERIYELWYSKNIFKRLARKYLFHQI